MVIVAVIVLLLVREAPAAREVAEPRRGTAAPAPWRDEVAEIMAGPNARVLVTGILVFWSGLSATGYLAIVYFEKVQHAGANVQTIAGWVSGVPVVMFGLGLGYVLSRRPDPQAGRRADPGGGHGGVARAVHHHPHLADGGAGLRGRPALRRLRHLAGPHAPAAAAPLGGDGRAAGQAGGPLQPLRRGLLVPGRLGGRPHRRLPGHLAVPGRRPASSRPS